MFQNALCRDKCRCSGRTLWPVPKAIYAFPGFIWFHTEQYGFIFFYVVPCACIGSEGLKWLHTFKRDRLSRIGKIASSSCLYCEGISDSTAHLLSCTLNAEVSTPHFTVWHNFDQSVYLNTTPITLLHNWILGIHFKMTTIIQV